MKKKYRGKGTGSVTYDKARGKWIGSYVNPYTGKRKPKRFDTKEEANRYATNNTTDILNDNYISGELTFGEWLIEWLRTYKCNLKQSTLDNYKNRLMAFSSLYDTPLIEIKPITLQAMFNRMTISPSTKRSTLTVLNIMLNKAVKIGLIRSNPAKSVELPPVVKKPIKIFTTEEIKKALDYLYLDENYRMYTFYKLLAGTGMRVGELLALSWENVDLKNKTIKVESTAYYRKKSIGHLITTPKNNNAYRTIILGDNLTKTLAEFRSKSKVFSIGGYVFATKNGMPMLYQYVREFWQLTLIKLGIPYKSIHKLRHTHATMLLSNNVPVTEVANRLGDTPEIIFKRYAHAIPSKSNEVAIKSEKLYGF